ncbi:MAG: hypothetical protein AAF734_00490 [Bacteroidota bacterium]
MRVKDCEEPSNIQEVALFKDNFDRKVIMINNQAYKNLFILQLDKHHKVYETEIKLWEDIPQKLLPEEFPETEDYFIKLPEYGTTILACKSEQDFLEDPDAFWEEIQQNHPERIIKLAWDIEQGKFYIKDD